ncbi:MAG: T9SS type A sorting domain-containing protein, partial [Phaeodactylibacter sp.]|nr:T9SS type A sorting domain-containing protein [Phaeodactylibacter sp.]
LEHYILTYDEAGHSWVFNGVEYSEMVNGDISEGVIADLDIYSNEIRHFSEAPDGRIVIGNGSSSLDIYDQGTWTHLSTPLDTFSTAWNFINDLAYDDEGRLWMTTNHGLFILEGDSWTHLTAENSDFPLSYAFKLSIGLNGQVAISSGNEIGFFDGSNWTHYTPSNSPLTEESLKGILVDNNGVLWASTFDQALHRVEAGNWQTYTSYNSMLPSDFWAGYNMHADANGNVWIPLGSWGALRIKPDNTWTIFNAGTPLEGTFVQRIKTGTDGNIYFQTNMFEQWNGAQEWTHFDQSNTPLPSYLSAMFVDSQNRLWCGTTQGVFVRGELDIVNGTLQPAAWSAPRITAFPNPGTDVLNLDFRQALEKKGIVRVFDMSGKILQTTALPAGAQKQQLDVKALPSGFYYIQVEAFGQQHTIPWVKQ